MHATLLRGGLVFDAETGRFETRDLVLQGDRVAAADAEIPTTTSIDCQGCLVLPGQVVAHTHAYSALAAGMPAPPNPTRNFLEILQGVWWRLDAALDEDSLRASAEVAAALALKSGVTCLVDHHESPNFIAGSLDVIANAFESVGVRGVLTYGATDRHGADGARAGIKESVRFANEYREHSTLRGAVGLHAPFTCSDETLAEAADAAKQHWLHYHAAEGPDDQAAAAERWNKRLFHQLNEVGLLNGKTIVAHGVQMDASEIDTFVSSGAWLTHQARSNMNNGVGYARHVGEIPNAAIGTDGIDDDLLREVQAWFFCAREAHGPSAWPDPVAMWSQGRRLIGEIFSEDFLSLQPGTPADVVVMNYDLPTPVNGASLGAHLLFGLSSRSVRDVFVAGRLALRNRKLTCVDETALFSRAREATTALFKRLES